MVGSHRSHAWYLAKGGSLKGLIAELYGKHTGCSRGAGGSMHLFAASCGFYGSTSIVGGTIPYGVGLAFADLLRDSTAKTVITFGDAAVEEGVFHEAANFASLKRLNVLFVCENNQYSCYTHISGRRKKGAYGYRFDAIARAHRLHYRRAVENSDVFTIKKHTELCMDFLPAFLEIPVWRHLEHCGPNNDDHLNYRPTFPLDGLYCEPGWRDEIQAEIDEAFRFAEDSPPAEIVSAYAD